MVRQRVVDRERMHFFDPEAARFWFDGGVDGSCIDVARSPVGQAGPGGPPPAEAGARPVPE